MDTSVRVKEATYMTTIKARGALEQTFGKKLTLDQTIYLATSYATLIYEIFQPLMKEGQIIITTNKNGTPSVRWSDLDIIARKALPAILVAFMDFQKILEQKPEEPLTA